MNKILIILTFIFIGSTMHTQQQRFTYTIDECCVRIVVDPNIVQTWPFWNVRIPAKSEVFNNTTHPDGIIDYCFTFDGTYVIELLDNNGLYSQSVVIDDCNEVGATGFHDIVVEGCCVTFYIINNTNPPMEWDFVTWDLDGFFPFQISRSQNGNLDVLEICFNNDGQFYYTLTYENNNQVSGSIVLDNCEEPPPPLCYRSWQCWHEVANAWGEAGGQCRCFNGVRLQMPDGTIKDIDFSPIIIVGGYSSLFAAIQWAITSQGYSVDAYADDPDEVHSCDKGPGAYAPGFFFYSQVRVLNVLGDGCFDPANPCETWRREPGDDDFSDFEIDEPFPCEED
jgi:hypothetical protein